MGDDGTPGKFPRRERVTLKFESPPLLLPGEEEPAGEEEGRRTAIPPAPELADGEDAWSRQRPVAPPPVRKPATVPPPALEEEAEGGALELVDKRSRPSSPTIDLSHEMIDRYALGDYTAALRIAELILGTDAGHPAATSIAESSRDRLGQLYTSRLGSLERVPRVAVDAAEVRWLGLDHRAAFLLSRIDGEHTLEEIVAISGMRRLETLKTIVELLELGAIGFAD